MPSFCRVSLVISAAIAVSVLSGCYAPPQPPLVRHQVPYEPPPPPEPPSVAVLVSSETPRIAPSLAEQRRPQIMDYLRERGYLRADERVVNDAARADRIIRVALQDDGSYRVDVLEPRASTPEIGREIHFERSLPPPTIYRYQSFPDPFDPFYAAPFGPRFYDPYYRYHPGIGLYHPRSYYRPILPLYPQYHPPHVAPLPHRPDRGHPERSRPRQYPLETQNQPAPGNQPPPQREPIERTDREPR
jgi:hypothetical protein